MATLQKISTGILGGREFWDLKNGLKVISSESEGQCTLFVSGVHALVLSKFLEVRFGFSHSLTQTIDSYAIVVPGSRKKDAIEILEKWPGET